MIFTRFLFLLKRFKYLCVLNTIIYNMIKTIQHFVHQLFEHRNLIENLTKRDFSAKYVKNYFGIAWAILDPLFFILILYFVFHYRFGTIETLGVPFVTYLITGYISYNLFSNALTSVTACIKEYSFLNKKVNFDAAIIPIVKLLSEYLMHFIIIIIVMILLWIAGITPTWLWFQVLYFQFALFMFMVGCGWITSSIALFFPDIKNIIGIITRLMFFITPIFWSMESLPEEYTKILKLNPIVYIVQGYRDSFLFNKPFWNDFDYLLYFWVWTILLIVIGIVVFRKLRPHFADVI
ncbi:MAG: ABC transporter permease [Bacteroidia bacterium]|nr:ABC transporter permease [Bacteroidia bacterium]